MSRVSIFLTALLLVPASASLAEAACRTSGPNFFVNMNDSVTFQSTMDRKGCRHSYWADSHLTFQKAVAMKQPAYGKLSQVGEFAFFYKPNPGYVGRDEYVIYICGSNRHGSGCSRLRYEATVK